MNITIDKTYIIHFEKLVNRKSYLDNAIIDKVGFHNFEYIISTEESDKNILKKNSYVFKPEILRHLSNAEICNYEIQFGVWKKIANENYDNCLIVEDDIIFKENFNENFASLLNDVPEDYDICFIAECCNLYPNNPHKLKFIESHTNRCCVGYIISKKACQKLITINEFNWPVDNHLDFARNTLNLKFYWSDPTVFDHGSTLNYESNAGRP